MAVLNIEYYSEVLGMNRKVNIIYPQTSKEVKVNTKDIPVLYLLHGMSGNENSWMFRSGIESLIAHTNLAIVMPSTDLGFYVNTTYGMNYFNAIALELPQVIHQFFPNLSTDQRKSSLLGRDFWRLGNF